MASTVTFEHLLSGARNFVHLPLNAQADGHTDVFLSEAGVVVEWLAKVELVQEHPTLLSEVNGSDDMLLRFAGVIDRRHGRRRTTRVVQQPGPPLAPGGSALRVPARAHTPVVHRVRLEQGAESARVMGSFALSSPPTPSGRGGRRRTATTGPTGPVPQTACHR